MYNYERSGANLVTHIIMNSFTVDLEDWYHGIEKPIESWNKYPERLIKGLYPLLQLLEEHNTKATFFTLGWIGDRYPNVIREIANSGHEIASHGYSHEKVYNLSPENFREEIRTTKKILEDITGTLVEAYRAPFFSITNESTWALGILSEEGYSIDCSISPVKTWRYGISNVPDEIFTIKEYGLIEYPVSAFNLFSKRIGIGGAYFRIFPYFFTKNALLARKKNKKPNMFYIHPWEYDPEHPVVDMEKRAKITHYTRLAKTMPYTKKLLKEFKFDNVSNIVELKKANGGLNEYSIEILRD